MSSFLTNLFRSPPALPGLTVEDGDDLNLPRAIPLTIHDIPIEAIFEILKRMDEANLDSVQNVCRLWYSLIDEWKGRDISTSTRRIIHPDNPDVSKEGWALISEIGIRSFFIVTENRDLMNDPPPASPLPHFKFPYLLKYLFLLVPVHSEIFKSLVKDTINLSTLIISFRALSELKSEHLEHLNFPQLKVLKLQGSRNDPYQLGSLPKLRTLLDENSFPRLTHLKLKVKVTAEDDFSTLHPLISFIQRHTLLKELSVGMDYPFNVYTIPALNLPPLPATYYPVARGILREMEMQKCSQFGQSLKILNITGSETWSFPHRWIWEGFLKKLTSTSVEEAELEIGPIAPAILQGLLSRNESTLKKLIIWPSMGREELGGLDLGIFASLRCLLTLKIEGRYELTGARSLPSTLESIRLRGTVSGDDVDHILLSLPNLREIRLELVNNDHLGRGSVIGRETLQQFVKSRKVDKLELRGRLQGIPTEGICNGDPNNPIMLTYNGEMAYWWLNADGYYTTYNT